MSYCADCTSPFEDDDDPLRDVGALLDSSDLEADEGTKPHLSLPIVSAIVTVAENKAVVPPFRWPPLLDRSFMALTDAIFFEETRGRLATDDDLIKWRLTLLPLYCSIPRPVLAATLDGSLPHKVRGLKDPDVYLLYNPDENKAEHEQHPWYLRNQSSEGYAIYVRWLVDAQGLAPTIEELLRVVDCLRNYVAGNVNGMQTAVAIDNVTQPDRSDVDALVRGEHYYLSGKEQRAALVYTWCRATELRCASVPLADRTKPLPKPQSYCGYAKTVSKREKSYKRNQSTTWLVMLVEAACVVLFPDRHLRLRTYTVCYLATQDEVDLAERIFTRCTDSRVDHGGFCVAAPGQCSSAKVDDDSVRWREENLAEYYDQNMLLERENMRATENKQEADAADLAFIAEFRASRAQRLEQDEADEESWAQSRAYFRKLMEDSDDE